MLRFTGEAKVRSYCSEAEGRNDIENVKNKISTLKNALYILTKMEEKSVEEMVGAILIIAENVDADEKEFLEIHHKKFLKNLNIRTKESY